MKKLFFQILLLVSLFFASLSGAQAQQDAQFSQYMFNQQYLNPAVVGLDTNYIHTGLIFRQQWLGYKATFDDGGAPSSTVLSINAPIKRAKSGIGLHLVYDVIGPVTNTEIQLSYAYHIPIKNGRFSIGLRAGMYNQSTDFSKFRPVDRDDPLLSNAGRINQFVPDFSLGVYLSKPTYFVGASMNHLSQSEISYATSFTFASLKQSLNVVGGYNWAINENITIMPSALVRFLPSDISNTLSYEATILGNYETKARNNIYFGFGFRDLAPTNDLIFLLGINNLLKDNSLSIGYAFDYVLNGSTAKAPTSHEFRLGYRLPAPKRYERNIIRTPRFRF
jgi:type IX secretion system PorP/SprF family membrane protein